MTDNAPCHSQLIADTDKIPFSSVKSSALFAPTVSKLVKLREVGRVFFLLRAVRRELQSEWQLSQLQERL